MIDLDAQGNASTGLGVSREMRDLTSYHVLIGEAAMSEAIVATNVKGLDLCAASEDLSGADLDLSELPRRAHRLSDAMRDGAPGTRVMDRFDYVLVDCPPSLSMVTINAMVAADGILVPLQCEFYALEGLSQLLKTVRRVKSTLNPALDIQGVVLTMHDVRNNLSGTGGRRCARLSR